MTEVIAEVPLRPKVVLLNPPSRRPQIRDFYCSVTAKGDYCWAPIDLLVMSGRLDAGFDLQVVDAVGERLSPSRAMERLLAARPHAVVSLMSSSSYIDDVAFLLELKRRWSGVLAVCGNLCLDRRPWLLREHRWLDAAIKDFTSPSIVPYLEAGGRGNEPLPGLDFRREDDRIVEGGRESGVLSYPPPRHDLFPLERYRLPYSRRYPLATVITGYGCPYACSYCIQSHEVIGFRARPLEEIVAELELLRRLGVAELYFRDPLFAADRRLALALCDLMRGMGFAWSCDCRVDRVDAELLARMKAAGCVCVAFGIESADEELIEPLGKSTTREKAGKAIALCREHGILSAGYFILGLPGQDEASVLRTIRFAVESGLDFASFTAAVPDHGTALRERAIESGQLGAGEVSADRNCASTCMSDRIGPQRLKSLLRRATWEFYGRPSYILSMLARAKGPKEFVRITGAGLAMARHYGET